MRRAAAVLVLLSAGLSGCYSKATAEGGKLTLAYASGVEVENFVKPIAPGAKLDVVAFANGTENELALTGARSSRPDVVAVDAVRERRVTLRAGEPGVAEIEVTARDDAGHVLVDKMFFHVAKPATHGLEHSCTEQAEAAYVRGENVDVYHGLATSDRRPVIGYGYAPLRIEPSGALELVAQPQEASLYRFRAPSTNARVSLRSTVDDKVLTMRIVERGELTDASLAFGDRILENQAEYVVVHVRLGETALCSQNALTRARSLTPTICSVTARLDEDPEHDENREQLVMLTALKFGVCKLEVTLPELAGGRGVVLTGEAKVGRAEFPGEGGSMEWWRVTARTLEAWARPTTAVYASRDGVGALVWLLWWLRRRKRR